MRIPPSPEEQRRIDNEVNGCQEEVARLISEGALYVPITVTMSLGTRNAIGTAALVPTVITRRCPRCDGQQQRWAIDRGLGHNLDRLEVAAYRCRNCGVALFNVLLTVVERKREKIPEAGVMQAAAYGASVFQITKVGQDPQPDIDISKGLRRALGKHEAFYRKALVCRNQGYGIGAVAYLRRIVEDTTDSLLDLLGEVIALEPGRETDLKRLDEAKSGRTFDEKGKRAAEILPSYLRPGGVNPIGLLFDVFSIGLHELSEEEAIRIADRAIGGLGYLYTQLVVHVEERKAFVTQMQRLQELQQETRETS